MVKCLRSETGWNRRRGRSRLKSSLVLIVMGALLALLPSSTSSEARTHLSSRTASPPAPARLLGVKSDTVSFNHSSGYAPTAESRGRDYEEGVKAPAAAGAGGTRERVIFIFKKTLAPLFFPTALSLEVLLAGLILLWFTRRQRAGKVIVSLGFLLLAMLSHDSVADRLLGPLEHKYPSLLDPRALASDPDLPRPVKWVVVLGGGRTSDPRLPMTSRLSSFALVRLIEGIRIYRELPGSKLVLSGGSPFGGVSEAEGAAELALALGVDERDLVLETTSRDTKDQAQLVKRIVGSDAFILVTSASHMPRSIALFRKQGMRPIPAPTGHEVKGTARFHPGSLFPKAFSLWKSEMAFYEYLGLTWAKLRGQI